MKILTFIRDGDYIDVYENGRRIEYVRIERYYSYTQSSATLAYRGMDPVNDKIEIKYGVQKRPQSIPVMQSHSMRETYITVDTPYHPKYTIPCAILVEYPDITVTITYTVDLCLESVVLTKNGLPHYTNEYPHRFDFCEMSLSFKNYNYDLHSTTGPAKIQFSYNMYALFMSKKYKYTIDEYNRIIESLYFNYKQVLSIHENNQYEYWNNGRLIPTELIKQGIIDYKNFNAEIDTFTLDLHNECK